MDCTSCGRANRAGARFCGGCGRPLAPRCPACASECEPGALFCDACGAPLAARGGEAAEARKVVTIVFADLMGSTALHERLDAESTRAFMERYYQAMRCAVEAQRGQVTQLLGDGVKAVFGAPRVAEDDAIRAVRAAVGMQRAFRALADAQREAVGRLGLRVAVHTGEVVADGESEIIGDPVNVAACLQHEAHDGDVLLGESTQRLVGQQVTLAPFGTFALKNRSEPVSAWRVVSLERPAGAPALAFVGREDELRRIAAVYDAALAAPGARLAVILGSPGLGKSRLLAELARRLGDSACVLSARCDATGGATFAPIAEALRAGLRCEAGADRESVRAAVEAVVQGDGGERARVAEGIAALLAGAPAIPEETFFVVRRLLAALAAKRPVLLAIDDLHWAEPLLLDLVEHLVQWSSGVPLCVLATARPELRERRSSLSAPGGLVSEVVTLSGLEAGAATRLAANVIGADELPAAIAGRVLATSEGNPLFVGELVRMLVEDGALVREGERWVGGAPLADLEMPPTIHALLAARIERLRPEERALLERASVVGRHFSRAAVAALAPPELRGELDARLEALRRSELIEPDTGWFLGDPALRFHHLLIRDAAYRRLLKGTRAELHARFADWLEARVGEDAAGLHDETLGWHLEQAHRHLRELGPVDARGRSLGERAARHLAAAGRRALARDDLPLAASLLGRAADRLDADAPARADLALDWCEALLSAGDVGPAAAAVAELGRFRGASERLRAWHTCFAGQLAVLTDPQALRATADAVAAAAELLTAEGDAAGEAKAHSVHALALARLGEIGAGEAALDRALAAARRVGDRRRQNAVLAGAPLAALWGPSPVTRASGRCLDVVRVLRITQGAPAVEAVALCCQGVLEALRGRADAARRMIASARRLVEELGITQRLLEAEVFAGQVELLEGDPVAAERYLRGAYDGLRSQGLGIDAAQAAALLGRALLAQGRAAEAEALSRESEAQAGDDLKAAITWRGVRAEALAQRGEYAAAVDFASQAVELAAATDNLLDHADARMALAAALRSAGRSDAAAAEEARAIELWEAKGATLLAGRVRRDAGRAEPGAREPRAPARSPRRVRANAATANAARLDSAIAARDADALPALFADPFEVEDHQTGVVYDRRGSLASWRSTLWVQELEYRQEPLATLGDSLVLLCQSSSGIAGGRLDAGAYEREEIVLVEVDAQGRRRQAEIFARDRLGDAVARLYARYAEQLPEGPARERAQTVAQSVVRWLDPRGLEGVAAAVAPAVEFVDHRPAGLGTVHGAELIRLGSRAQHELARDIVFRIHDVLALCPGAFLLRSTTSGVDRASGGAYERPLLLLGIFGPDGLVTRVEWFDPEADAAALARFGALTAEPAAARFEELSRATPRTAQLENAATRAEQRAVDAMTARDWERFAALFPPRFRSSDRRKLMRLELDRDQLLDSFRPNFEMSAERASEVLATRGDRLALLRVRLVVRDGSGGPSEVEFVQVLEVDERGERLAAIAFDAEDLDDAYAELDLRYLATEGAPHAALFANLEEFRRAAPAVDRAALTRVLPDDFSYVNHRHFAGTGARMTRDEYVASLGVIGELGVHSQLRLEHLRIGASAGLGGFMWSGTREGGDFDMPLLFVFRHDGSRLRSLELYDEGQHEAARARYAELSAVATATPRIETAATRGMDRMAAAWRARDWKRFAALFSADHRTVDRRKMMQSELTRDEMLEGFRSIFETAPRLDAQQQVIATRGDRLALIRERLTGEIGLSGTSEVEYLLIIGVDERGDLELGVAFDLDALDAAYAELELRFAAGEAASARRASLTREFSRAFAARDWEALAALLAPDLVVEDHRRLGWETLHGPEAYLQALRALVELAPDVRLRVDHVSISDPGFLYFTTWQGTREGGAFEEPSIIVCELDAAGRIRRFDQYDLERQDEARARLAAVGARAVAADPLRIPPNAATRASDRVHGAREALDWDAFEAACAPVLEFDDRRRSMLSSGDRDMFIANSRWIAAQGIRVARSLLATAGDRLALERGHWTGANADVAAFEMDTLSVTEVEAEGRVVAVVIFDPDDRRAASAEMRERFFRGEAAHWPRKHVETLRAWHDHDLVRLRAALPDGFEFHDHRRTGAGHIAGADTYVRSVAALFEQSPDLSAETLYHLALEPHGSLAVARSFGTLVGGGAVESLYLRLSIHRDGEFVAMELFELDDLEHARARFEALHTQ